MAYRDIISGYIGTNWSIQWYMAPCDEVISRYVATYCAPPPPPQIPMPPPPPTAMGKRPKGRSRLPLKGNRWAWPAEAPPPFSQRGRHTPPPLSNRKRSPTGGGASPPPAPGLAPPTSYLSTVSHFRQDGRPREAGGGRHFGSGRCPLLVGATIFGGGGVAILGVAAAIVEEGGRHLGSGCHHIGGAVRHLGSGCRLIGGAVRHLGSGCRHIGGAVRHVEGRGPPSWKGGLPFLGV